MTSRRPSFTAIDFETANCYRNSACAVGVVRVRRGRIVERAYHLIRPPFRRFDFTGIHGIEWGTVSREPSFARVWRTIAGFFEDIDFLAAHFAPFDRSVLRACCAYYGLEMPAVPFLCTMQLARSTWGIRPTRLPDVADYLGLPLRHHDAASDAEVCAKIALTAFRT